MQDCGVLSIETEIQEESQQQFERPPPLPSLKRDTSNSRNLCLSFLVFPGHHIQPTLICPLHNQHTHYYPLQDNQHNFGTVTGYKVTCFAGSLSFMAFLPFCLLSFGIHGARWVQQSLILFVLKYNILLFLIKYK